MKNDRVRGVGEKKSVRREELKQKGKQEMERNSVCGDGEGPVMKW